MAYLIKNVKSGKYSKSNSLPNDSENELITDKLDYGINRLLKENYASTEIVKIFKDDLIHLYKKGFSVNKLHSELKVSSYALSKLFKEVGILRDFKKQQKVSNDSNKDLSSLRNQDLTLKRSGAPRGHSIADPDGKDKTRVKTVNEQHKVQVHQVHNSTPKKTFSFSKFFKKLIHK